MQLAKIVVQADDDWCSDERVRIAAALAAEHGAELIGLVCNQSAAQALAGVATSRDVEALAVTELRRHCTDAAQRFQTVASQSLDRNRLQEVQGELAASLLDASLVADLLVISQDPGPRDAGEAIATQIVLGAPCPVLVVPRDYCDRFRARRILVGWKGSVPTARALRGALPLLQRADAVLLAHVAEPAAPQARAMTIMDAAAWLRGHGVELTTIELAPDPDDPGHTLLDEADRFGADLIVAGAFARTPFRERLLGGATATLLAESDLPLLLAH